MIVFSLSSGRNGSLVGFGRVARSWVRQTVTFSTRKRVHEDESATTVVSFQPEKPLYTQSQEEWLKLYNALLKDHLRPNGMSLSQRQSPYPYLARRCPELKSWAQRQRADYYLHLQRKPTDMTPERIMMLEELRKIWYFEWRNLGSSLEGKKWMERLFDLDGFARKHGHCRVPYGYDEDRSLSFGVKDLRQQYNESKPNKLHKVPYIMHTRKDLLSFMGFDWDPNETLWNKRYNELVEYSKHHGNCLVPQKYAEVPELGKWVDHQRNQAMRLKAGKPSPMTKERIAKLESIGFDMDPLSTQWDQQFNELVDYKAKHGNCNVPRTYKENQKLANWVDYQRRQYKRLKAGKSSPMTQERIDKLENVGFDWSPLDTAWNARFQELQCFVEENGNGSVPGGKENSSLYKWVKQQQRHHQQGKLSKDRIDRLDFLGLLPQE